MAGVSSGVADRPFVANESSALERLVMLRGQAGYLVADDLQLYGVGGAAAGRVLTDSGLNFLNGAHYDGGRSQTLIGWTAGAGAEYLFATAWGVKLEYLHYDLGDATTDAYRRVLAGFHTQSTFDVSGDLLRVAVDYHLGDPAGYSGDDGPLAPIVQTLSTLKYVAGVRYWYGDGTMRYSLRRDGPGLNSRLSYTGLESHSGELFARIDHPAGFFGKMTIAAAAVADGRLTDEDFPPVTTPASRTQSSQHDGALSYVTADAGYTLFDRAGIQIAPFVGFAYYHDQLNAYGCTQRAANPNICAITSPSALTISEDADWDAIRIGLSGSWITPWDGLRLGLDAAWLPYGQIDGNDDHWLRLGTPGIRNSLAGPIGQTGIARGLQLEATASMPLTDQIDAGLGGRYWYLYSRGASLFDGTFSSFARPETDFSTRRAGVFAQMSVHF